MFWDLEGPGSGGGGPYDWGKQQGTAAGNAWDYSVLAQQYIGGRTVFADVESCCLQQPPCNPGWNCSPSSGNQQVLQGWLDAVDSYGYGQLNAGVYISFHNWAQLFGKNYRPSRTFVVWLNGCQTCTIAYSPCSQPSADSEAQVEAYVPTLAQETMGGSQMVLAQYWVGGCGCGDYDVSIEDPRNAFFSGRGSGTTYQCSGCGSGGCP